MYCYKILVFTVPHTWDPFAGLSIKIKGVLHKILNEITYFRHFVAVIFYWKPRLCDPTSYFSIAFLHKWHAFWYAFTKTFIKVWILMITQNWCSLCCSWFRQIACCETEWCVAGGSNCYKLLLWVCLASIPVRSNTEMVFISLCSTLLCCIIQQLLRCSTMSYTFVFMFSASHDLFTWIIQHGNL